MTRARGAIDEARAAGMAGALTEAPSRMTEVLNHDEALREIARDVAKARDVLYLGRGTAFPLAMEGALKLKEITYMSAEAYAAGELKHGPLALVDTQVPVVALAPYNPLLAKMNSNLAEVRARGGQLIVVADEGVGYKGSGSERVLTLPKSGGLIAPIVYTLPLQLLAYHAALYRGTNVDQPRNLAKSVTVE